MLVMSLFRFQGKKSLIQQLNTIKIFDEMKNDKHLEKRFFPYSLSSDALITLCLLTNITSTPASESNFKASSWISG